MPKTYIVVTPFFPSPDNWRGAYCYDFVKALQVARPAMRVEVFMPGNGDDYEIEGVRVHRFRVKLLPSNVLPFLFRRYNEKSFLRTVTNAGISIDDIAICHAHTANFAIYPLALKRLNARIETLLHHHDPASFGLNLGVLRHFWPYNLLMFPILRRLHQQVDCHVFISSFVRSSFESAPDANISIYDDYRKQMKWLPYSSARIKKGVVLHNGVDTSLFTRHQNCIHYSIFTIGVIGNFLDWKSQITLFRACAILKKCGVDVKVIAMGSGPELEKCKRYANENGLRVEFRSEVWHEKLPDFYHSINLFVLPSYFEGFGCVYTEAHACGVPFIACKGQGIEDLIPESEKHLWLVNPEDPEDLADKIRYYIENRPAQHLEGPITFEELMPPFLKEIGV